MVFVCPPKEETESKTKTLCKLKEVLKEIEDGMSVPVNPICVPCCVPLCDIQSAPFHHKPGHDEHKPKHFNPPNVMVCYKIPSKKSKSKKKGPSEESGKGKKEHSESKVKPSKSRELRASILYRGCDCEQRNGLQDDCPRTGCHGSPECLTQPPTCGPSEFCNGKHLRRAHGKGASHAQAFKVGGGGPHGYHGLENAQYKCFPAVLKGPVCCTPCQ